MSAARDLIAAELAGVVSITRKHAIALRIASFGDQWVDSRTAARVLCTSRHGLCASRHRYVDAAIDSKPASLNGSTTARGCGKLYRRADCERAAAVRARCHVSLAVACRIYAAIKKGGAL